ncbi:hypothetical protein [Nonomuraea gerenzanensis]|uniref:Large Ala/Glu-rich protein n=1 Tax=Nonomuraea gerenzanensis TaxID=93944 RepID=A0A1M4ED01_9ACTN|nr:hypothetical protein [Nonomuraea gerenzanensis]UBU08311.1 hypothetical protein LCN96_28320 [Nonomuraea gerenzanensis]SBO96642.1 large Ala/Glu-rich protein [Nonomuraea gerenzanensis]
MLDEQEARAILAVLEDVTAARAGQDPLGGEAERLAAMLRGRLAAARGQGQAVPDGGAELRESLAAARDDAADQRDTAARHRDEAAVERDRAAVVRRHESHRFRAEVQAADSAVRDLLEQAPGTGDPVPQAVAVAQPPGRDADGGQDRQDRLQVQETWEALRRKEQESAGADEAAAAQDRLLARRDRAASARDRASARNDRQLAQADREQSCIDREQRQWGAEEPGRRADALRMESFLARVRDVRQRTAEAARRGELARESVVAARRRAEHLAERTTELRRRWLAGGDGEQRAW